MFDLNTPEGLEQVRQALAQTAPQAAVTVMEPEQETAATVAEPTEPHPLTEKEAITIVQSWVAEDVEVELLERRSVEEMVEALQDAGEYRGADLSISRLKEIVNIYAPNALKGFEQNVLHSKLKTPPYPSELASLVASGAAVHEDGYWLVKRCQKCGNFRANCCGPTELVSAVRNDEMTLTSFGRQAVGLDSIKTPKPPKSLEAILEDKKRAQSQSKWWSEFRGVDELEGNGTVKMYIENFLPEGATLICGLPKEGKSFLALSVAKALTSGKPLFGRPGFEVPEPVPVLYLAAESGDGALKLRCKRMGITNDKTKFIARTLSQGLMFGLDDPMIEALVKDMRPVVVLETLIRFNDGKNEDDASENRKLAEAIFRLIAWGAKAVIGIHHSRKDLNKANPSKEAAVRGSGDGLAMVDAVWLVMQDERLFKKGAGPNEIEIVGWGRDFNPVPMRVALTKKAPKPLPPGVNLFAPGIVSHIDLKGDLEWVQKGLVFEQTEEIEQRIKQLVIEDPSITKKDIVEKVKTSEWNVRNTLKSLGYYRGPGGKKGGTQWVKGDKPSETHDT